MRIKIQKGDPLFIFLLLDKMIKHYGIELSTVNIYVNVKKDGKAAYLVDEDGHDLYLKIHELLQVVLMECIDEIVLPGRVINGRAFYDKYKQGNRDDRTLQNEWGSKANKIQGS